MRGRRGRKKIAEAIKEVMERDVIIKVMVEGEMKEAKELGLWLEGYSQTEIARKNKMTQSGVSRRIKKQVEKIMGIIKEGMIYE